MQTIIFFEIALYLLIMIAIGVYFSKVELSHTEFLLNKKIPAWVVAFSERATGSSAWLMLGFTGFVFSTGLSAIWMAVGSVLGALFSWFFMADRFRRESNENGSLTLPTFIVARFNQNRKLILYSASFLIIVFFMFYLGAQIAGAGKTLYTIFDMSPVVAMIICTLIIITLSFWGGFTSVVWTDMIQGIMMLITLTVIPIVALIKINELDLSIATTLQNAGEGMNSWGGGLTGFALGILFFNNFSYFFGYLGGQPQLSTRFMALKDKRDVKIGSYSVLLWSLLSFGGAFLIGLTALTLYNDVNFSDVEVILPYMILDLTPTWLGGILLAGIIAAIVTTADSQLMVIVSSINEDILNHGMGKTYSEKTMMKIAKILVVAVALTGLFIAFGSDSLVLLVVSWAWGGVGGTLSAVIVLSFIWKKYSSIGAFATILSGLVFTIIWISTPLEEIITSKFTTFFIALMFGVLFSYIFPDKKKKLSAISDVNL